MFGAEGVLILAVGLGGVWRGALTLAECLEGIRVGL